jgi:POT family proton-dependent oligopeptide transporter
MVSFSYLFHTIGALSFAGSYHLLQIIPVKYALMMGVYFAATGLGNKVWYNW